MRFLSSRFHSSRSRTVSAWLIQFLICALVSAPVGCRGPRTEPNADREEGPAPSVVPRSQEKLPEGPRQKIRWTFTAGDRWREQAEQSLTLVASLDGQPDARTSWTLKVDSVWEVLESPANGPAKLQVTLEDLAWQAETPEEGPQRFASQGPASDGMLARQLAGIWKSMQDNPLTLRVSSDGIVSSVDFPKTVLDTFRLHQQWERDLTSVLEQGWLPLPAEGLVRNVPWTRSLRVPWEAKKVSELEEEFFYQGQSRPPLADAGPSEYVAFTSVWKLPADSTFQTIQQSGHGDLWFAPEQGRIVYGRFRFDWKGEFHGRSAVAQVVMSHVSQRTTTALPRVDAAETEAPAHVPGSRAAAPQRLGAPQPRPASAP